MKNDHRTTIIFIFFIVEREPSAAGMDEMHKTIIEHPPFANDGEERLHTTLSSNRHFS
jgi:hypothetical protein